MRRYAQIRIVNCWEGGWGAGLLTPRAGGGPCGLILGPSGETAKFTIEHEPQVHGMEPYGRVHLKELYEETQECCGNDNVCCMMYGV